MNRLLILCFILLSVGILPLAAQPSISANTVEPIADSVIVYDEADLYNLDLLAEGGFTRKFSKGVWPVYNPMAITATEWSHFKHKTDPRISLYALQRPSAQNGYFILFLGSWLILSLLITKNQQYFKNMLDALFNHRLALQFAREQVANRTVVSIVYLFVFNLLLAILLMHVIKERGVQLSGWNDYLLLLAILVGVTVVYLFKYAFYKVLGFLFGMGELVSYYLSQVFLIHRLLGPVLLLLMALVFYAPQHISVFSMYSALVLLALSLVWRYVNAIRQVTNVLVAHAFHFILYFCAVEIIPTAVIAKFLLHV